MRVDQAGRIEIPRARFGDDPNGGLVGIVHASWRQIAAAFGAADVADGEWAVRTPVGPARLYDWWRLDEPRDLDEQIEWHIGSLSPDVNWWIGQALGLPVDATV